METRRYPVDTQTFSTIVEGDYVYVDKTDLVYKMTHEYRYVFLSRPRRFGKSLLCSTLDEYFNGNRDLFKGLKIDGLEKDWTKYPVINLDLSFHKEKNLKDLVSEQLATYEKTIGHPIASTFSLRMSSIIKALRQKNNKSVAVIIDSYDDYIIASIDNSKLQNQVRAIITDLLAPLKDKENSLRFVFMTGIGNFCPMMYDSVLNNIYNISLNPEYETVCGISKDEFLSQLREGIQDFADANGYTFDETVQYFKAKYDGYHFSPKMLDVYNPYSVINALNDKQLNDYWFNSGTPSSLLKLISKFDIKMEDYEGVECGASRFNKPVEKVTDLVPFLFQSGYLTIKDYKTFADEDNVFQTYTLGYPNGEVRMAFANSLYTEYYKATEDIALRDAYIDFKINDNLEKFIKALQKFFRRFPFSLNNMNEKHYHSILYTVLTSFGAHISANQETALGKSDLILKMPKTVYVIELKYDRSTDSALDQIDDRDYVSAVLDYNKRIVKLAIKFSSKNRNIESYEATEAKVS